MRKILIFLVWSLIIHEVFAQGCTIDEYNKALELGENGKKNLAEYRYDDALENTQNALIIFERCGDEYNKAIALSTIGRIYALKNELDLANKYSEEAYSIISSDNVLDANEIAIMGNLGKVYLMSGDPDKAIKLFNRALEWAEKNNDIHGQALALANIGAYYREIGNYSKAIEFHLQAAKLFESEGNIFEKAGQYVNIGGAYYLQNDYWSALPYLDEAERLLQSIGNVHSLNVVYYNRAQAHRSIGEYYKAIEDYNNSLEYLELSLADSEKLINSSPDEYAVEINILISKGDVESLQEYHNSAIKTYEKSLNILQEYAINNEEIFRPSNKLISSKILFENGILNVEKLEYNNASNYFEESAEKIKSTLTEKIYVNQKTYLEGIYHYIRSKMFYYRFLSEGNTNHKEASETELLLAKDKLNEAGALDLARLAVKEKIVNFPYSRILFDEYVLLLQGIRFMTLEYDEKILVGEAGNITFKYGYLFNIPPKGLPQLKFCCKNYCSDWYKIYEKEEIREARIKVYSDEPAKMSCDIKIYGEENPEIPIGEIKDYYVPTWGIPTFAFTESNNGLILQISPNLTHPYEEVNIVVEQTPLQKLKFWLEVIRLPIAILVGLFGIYKFYDYLKMKKQRPASTEKKAQKKKSRKGSQSR